MVTRRQVLMLIAGAAIGARVGAQLAKQNT